MTTSTDNTLSSTLTLLGQLPAASREGMVRMYRHSLKEHLDQMDAALQPGGDVPAAQPAAHRIAGSAGMMQDLALCEAARAMETAIREQQFEQARALWPDLRERAQVTLAALARAYPAVA